jgi:AraC-like DNA-binding protein
MEFTFENRPSDSPFVEQVWRTYSERDDTFLSRAGSNWEMVVWKYEGEARITVRGPETKAMLAETSADTEFFGIRFKLGTYMPHMPIHKLAGGAQTLPDATGEAFWLHDGVWQLPTFDNADTFVNRLMRAGLLVRDPVVETLMRGQQPDLSPRSLQYRFLHATGLTHNTARQIERAQRAVAMLQQGVSILDTVYDAGYFDQAHLTRSLKRFMGQTPAQIALARQP